MSGIRGELCENEDELKATEKAKKRDYIVRLAKVGEKIEPPWQRYRTRMMKRHKRPDEIFEDRLWLLLRRLGFNYLNKDRNCKLELKTNTKQIDVLGLGEHHVFVIQCRTKKETTEKIKSTRIMINEFVADHNEIRKALEEYFGSGKFAKVCHIIALAEREKRVEDNNFVREHPEFNIHLWSMNEIEYIENLVKSMGTIAKHQLYSVMFAGKRTSELERKCPAIKARIGNKVVYNFLINAKDLADYVYVHHREVVSIDEASQAYQRMLRPPKLKQIKEYIDDGNGYFVNNIILNFTREIKWERNKPKDQDSSVEIGTITLPGYFGCAWIIDGQHRLYGAASASKDILLPVIALEHVKDAEQATLFVDINKKQTSIAGNLLWDLYSDIYNESEETTEKKLWLVSEIAKRLGTNGALQKKIEFESDLSTHGAPLTLTTVCTAISQNTPFDKLITPEDLPEEKAKKVARTINCFFEAIRDLRKTEWENPKNNKFIFTNNVFTAFMMLFGDMVRHFDYINRKNLFSAASQTSLRTEFKKLLTPAIQFIGDDASTQKKFINNTGHSGHLKSAKEIAGYINVIIQEFSPHRLSDEDSEQHEKTPLPRRENVCEKAKKFEVILRNFVMDKLIEFYGSAWWKRGLPGEIKKDLDNIWKRSTTTSPELRSSQDPNKMKFERCDFNRLSDIIVYGENWGSDTFESIFQCDLKTLQKKIYQVSPARAALAHERSDTSQELLEAALSLRWFSKVLGNNSINPYIEK